MKIVCLSDTHMCHEQVTVPEGDVLVHAGDFGRTGSFEDLISLNKWLAKLPHKHKLLTPGNHDRLTQESLSQARVLLSEGTLLVDEPYEVDGVKFYFSPWTPWFGYWNWMASRGEQIAEKWARIPEDTDILITHGPPAGILDGVPVFNGQKCEFEIENAGCQDLYNRVMVVKPKVHIFGHIHPGHGQSTENGIRFVNAAICSDRNIPVNQPIVLEFEK